jgi:hypothetical protein
MRLAVVTTESAPPAAAAFSNPKMSLKTGYQAGIDLLSFFEF